MQYASTTFSVLFKDYVFDVHVPNILIGIGASIEVPLVTIIGRKIVKTRSEIANFVLLSSLCRSMLDIPFSIVLEYTGVRNMMLGSLLVNTLAALVGRFITDRWTLAAYCVLSGFSLGAFFLSRHIFVASVSCKKDRGIIMAFLSGLLRWAHVLGPSATGLITSRTGEVRNAFWLAAASSLTAFFAILAAPLFRRGLIAVDLSRSMAAATSQNALRSDSLVPSDAYEHGSPGPVRHVKSPTPRAGSHAVPVHFPDADETTGAARRDGAAGGGHTPLPEAAGVNKGGRRPRSPLPSSEYGKGVSLFSDPYAFPPTCPTTAMSTEVIPPGLSAQEKHHVTVLALWYTMLDSWSVIWRLGLYVILFSALRANRKLMIIFAGMQNEMDDAQISYLLSFGFCFDAVLFPLGGVMMNLLGRHYAMLPVALSLALAFLLLPLCHRHVELYMASAVFGIADALGCGVVMTLIADKAPKRYGGPFFGIIRTVEDLGHVVGAGGVSLLLARVGFRYCCWFLTAQGFFAAAWALWGVPRDDLALDTPRLKRVVEIQERAEQELKQLRSGSASFTAENSSGVRHGLTHYGAIP